MPAACRVRMGPRPGATFGSATAEQAAATAAAYAPSRGVKPHAGLASATGAALSAARGVKPRAGHAAATGIGRNASTSALAPPVFSNISETTPSSSGLNISWSVSPNSTGQVEYDTNPGVPYASATTLETGYFPSHNQILSGLAAGTLYYYRIKGVTAAGATGYSAEGTFTTAGGAVSCGVSLQAKIDAATAGTTVDVTGCVYSAGATVNKALTIVGCTINVPANQHGLTVTADDVTIQSVSMLGPQYSSYYDFDEIGIYAVGTAGNKINNLTIKDCVIDRFGGIGMWLAHCTNLHVGTVGHGNTVTRIAYEGIIALTCATGEVTDNTVSNIAEFNLYTGDAYNGYGIVFSEYNAGDGLCSDFDIGGNYVSYVPTWHAFDTHGCIRFDFHDNEAHFSRKGIYITTGYTGNAVDVTIRDNIFTDPYSTHPGGDVTAIWYQLVTNITITGNSGHGWGAGRDLNDYGNASTGEVISGNSFTN